MIPRSIRHGFILLFVGLPLCTLQGGCQVQTTGQCAASADVYLRYDCMRDTIFGGDARAMRSAVTASLVNGAMSFGTGGGSHSFAQLAKSVAQHAQVPTDAFAGDVSHEVEAYWADLVAKTGNDTPHMQSLALADVRADVYRLSRFMQVSREASEADRTLVLARSSAVAGTKPVGDAVAKVRERQLSRSEVIVSLQQTSAIYYKVFSLLGVRNLPEAQNGLTALDVDSSAAYEDFKRCEEILPDPEPHPL